MFCIFKCKIALMSEVTIDTDMLEPLAANSELERIVSLIGSRTPDEIDQLLRYSLNDVFVELLASDLNLDGTRLLGQVVVRSSEALRVVFHKNRSVDLTHWPEGKVTHVVRTKFESIIYGNPLENIAGAEKAYREAYRDDIWISVAPLQDLSANLKSANLIFPVEQTTLFHPFPIRN